MFAFYDLEECVVLGHAHSELPCHKQDEGDDHPPHVHQPEHTLGLFFCRGLPEVAVYTLEERS